jgi:hypothetical protein
LKSIEFGISATRRKYGEETRGEQMNIGTILLVILVLALLGVIPTWPHSREWGYGPSGGVGLILVIVLILFLLGRI